MRSSGFAVTPRGLARSARAFSAEQPEPVKTGRGRRERELRIDVAEDNPELVLPVAISVEPKLSQNTRDSIPEPDVSGTSGVSTASTISERAERRRMNRQRRAERNEQLMGIISDADVKEKPPVQGVDDMLAQIAARRSAREE